MAFFDVGFLDAELATQSRWEGQTGPERTVRVRATGSIGSGSLEGLIE